MKKSLLIGVDFDGTTGVAGAMQHSHAAPCAGAAYVYQQVGGAWREQPRVLLGTVYCMCCQGRCQKDPYAAMGPAGMHPCSPPSRLAAWRSTAWRQVEVHPKATG